MNNREGLRTMVDSWEKLDEEVQECSRVDCFRLVAGGF